MLEGLFDKQHLHLGIYLIINKLETPFVVYLCGVFACCELSHFEYKNKLCSKRKTFLDTITRIVYNENGLRLKKR